MASDSNHWHEHFNCGLILGGIEDEKNNKVMGGGWR
jgi:hypothetical protein